MILYFFCGKDANFFVNFLAMNELTVMRCNNFTGKYFLCCEVLKGAAHPVCCKYRRAASHGKSVAAIFYESLIQGYLRESLPFSKAKIRSGLGITLELMYT